MKEEWLERICQRLQGRALLEEEVKWALRSWENELKKLEDKEMDDLLGLLVVSGKVQCTASLEAISKEGEEPFFSFFAWMKRMLRFGKENAKLTYHCNRCGADEKDIHLVYCHRCRGECAYCRRCLVMGRSSCCVLYYLFPCNRRKVKQNIHAEAALYSYPQLTEAQCAAARSALEFYEGPSDEKQEFLVWAVCGAGKTEVMFPLLRYLLENGRSVLWATPRRDVVLELAPRLQRAFPDYALAVLHGNTPPQEKWNADQLVLATTHQALRFYRRFDVVIMDEVDAYPYTSDDMLPFAVNRARTLSGKTVYLTATPRPDYQKRMQKPTNHKDFLPHVKIPVRYHGHPLPEPVICRESKLNNRLRTRKPIHTLLSFIENSEKRGRPVFIFVPAIRQLPILYDYILAHNENWKTKAATVHASDPEREAKVMALREGRLQALLTTTIMERGVTLSGIQVLVYQADAPVFDEAALVQIAGRAGRSASVPDGQVIFMAEEVTGAMKAAIRQIKKMNRLARELGYISYT
ncbi:DEAD/DEAH box helicase [Aneurinibacillus aneurinilyticus]|jgi:competence protein ComFA|uniref:DEAD/DEAH box helicase n=1 Tax=Aneurinibacillus aneurinilyticus TaxID=1391 RepID=UPI0023F88A50|nr:helicase-related protein [Aneurinibacillus aneurinilyticus]MCI1693978.1 DEAD/DEAH box helicase family protein [Aneurinibacillus aneurinilyticus]